MKLVTQKLTMHTLQSAFLALALLVFTAFQAQAQGPKGGKKDRMDKKAKVEELRKAYMNEKLALTETEQKAFWPLYDAYKQKDKALRDSFRSKYKKNEVVFMDDKKAEEYLNATIKLKEDQLNLYKEYVNKFKKVLPVKKVALMPSVEKEFKHEIMKQAKMHHKPGDHHGPGPDSDHDDE